MAKLYRSPVQVELDAQQKPKRFRWLGRWHRVLNCTLHEDERHWWDRYKGLEPKIIRCDTFQGMICDLYFEKAPGRWVLERVWD